MVIKKQPDKIQFKESRRISEKRKEQRADLMAAFWTHLSPRLTHTETRR